MHRRLFYNGAFLCKQFSSSSSLVLFGRLAPAKRNMSGKQLIQSVRLTVDRCFVPTQKSPLKLPS